MTGMGLFPTTPAGVSGAMVGPGRPGCHVDVGAATLRCMPTSFFAAAEAVLRAAGGPLTAGEIAAAARAGGLIATSGKTPAATMSAALYTRSRERGSRIVRVYEPGDQRARRGSVRWSLREGAD